MQKGKIDIPIVKRAVPQSWNTSNGTFQTKRVGDIELSFVDYSTSKRVRITPDIVEYSDETPPMYDLILGKQSLHDLGVILDFKEKTITIDKILLPMRNIARLQLEPSVSRALRLNTCQELRNQSVPPQLPSVWWKFWMLSTKKQTFQPLSGRIAPT